MLPRPPSQQAVLAASLRTASAAGARRFKPLGLRKAPGTRNYSVEIPGAETTSSSQQSSSSSSGFGSAVKTVLGVVVVGAGAYGYAVHYALEHKDFRRWFVQNVPGGEPTVAQAKRWREDQTLDRLKNDAVAYKDNVVRMSSDTYNNVTRAAGTLSANTHDLVEKSKTWSADITTKTKDATSNLTKTTSDLYNKSAEVASSAKSKTLEVYGKAQELYDTWTGNPPTARPVQPTPKEDLKTLKEGVGADVKNLKTELVATEDKMKASAKSGKAKVDAEAAEVSKSVKKAAQKAEEKVKEDVAMASAKVKSAAAQTSEKAAAAAQAAKQHVAAAAVEVKDKASSTTTAVKASVEHAKDKATSVAQSAKSSIEQTVRRALHTPEIAALVATATQSADPIIGQLGHTLHELDSILGQLPGEQAQKEAQKFMIEASKEVNDLNARFAKIKTDSRAALEKSVADQEQKLEVALKDAELRSKEQVKQAEDHLRQDFALEKAELTLAHSEELKRQLSQQANKFNTKLQEELAGQAATLERRWLREVRLHVDKERGGRLARLDQLETRLVSLERVTDTNSTALQQSVRAHKLRSAIQSLRDTLGESVRRSFARELAAVKAVAENDPLIATVTEAIPSHVAETGVDTLPDLVARFSVVANEVRKVALVPADDAAENSSGLYPHAVSALMSNLMFRKHGLPEGDDVESILARTEFYLREEELDCAARELNQLKGWPRLIAKDWLKAARDHLEVKQALELIELQSSAHSLRMG